MAPKRKPTDNGGEKPSKKAKKNDADSNSSNANNDTCEWDLIAGGPRETIRLGCPEHERQGLLTLKFKNKETGVTREKHYSKKIEEINWDNARDIIRLNHWRTQIFRRDFKFPEIYSRKKWDPMEDAYLELLLEKHKKDVEDQVSAALSVKELVSAFNDFFGDAELGHEDAEPLGSRKHDSVASQLNRGRPRQIRDDIKKLPTDKRLGTSVPKITVAELQDYMPEYFERNPKKAAKKDLQVKNTKSVNNRVAEGEKDPSPPKSTSSEKSPKPTPSNKNSQQSSNTNEKRVESIDGNVVAEGGKDPSPPKSSSSESSPSPTPSNKNSPQPSYSDEKRVESIDGNVVAEGGKDPSPPKSTSSERSSNGIPIPSSPPLKKNPLFNLPVRSRGHQSPGSPDTIRPTLRKARKTEVKTTSPEALDRLRDGGWLVPNFPRNDEEAVRRLKEAELTKPKQDDSWLSQAREHLERRLKEEPVFGRGYYQNTGDRGDWWENCKDRATPRWDEENAPRHAQDANLAGLMNAATIPPLGYRGNIKDLVEKELLPAEELKVARFSKELTTRFHEYLDKAFDEWPAKKKKMEEEKKEAEKEKKEAEKEKKRKVQEEKRKVQEEKKKAQEEKRKRGPVEKEHSQEEEDPKDVRRSKRVKQTGHLESQ